ncbi:hypothetical protein ACS0TY_019630 [Phlomoides rotata]
MDGGFESGNMGENQGETYVGSNMGNFGGGDFVGGSMGHKGKPDRCDKGKQPVQESNVMHDVRCEVSKNQAYRAKIMALSKIEDDADLQHTKLWSYAEELRKTYHIMIWYTKRQSWVDGSEKKTRNKEIKLKPKDCTVVKTHK